MKSTVKEIVEKEILRVLPDNIQRYFIKIPESVWNQTYEIRLRAGQMPSLSMIDGEIGIDQFSDKLKDARVLTQDDISRVLGIMSQNSIYAVQEEIKAGFITLKGGHRVGLVGKVICSQGSIENIKYFSGMNIRIAREIVGSADEVLLHIIDNRKFINTLLISPPRCGKTTILRDAIRQLSNGIKEDGFVGHTIGLVDERSEIAACFRGIPQNDVGRRTDVLDNCPKAEGIMMLLRSMGPSIIATDEIGSIEDARAIITAVSAGVGILTTAHGSSMEDILRRPGMNELINSKVFGRIIILGREEVPGVIVGVYDGNLKAVNSLQGTVYS